MKLSVTLTLDDGNTISVEAPISAAELMFKPSAIAADYALPMLASIIHAYRAPLDRPVLVKVE